MGATTIQYAAMCGFCNGHFIEAPPTDRCPNCGGNDLRRMEHAAPAQEPVMAESIDKIYENVPTHTATYGGSGSGIEKVQKLAVYIFGAILIVFGPQLLSAVWGSAVPAETKVLIEALASWNPIPQDVNLSASSVMPPFIAAVLAGGKLLGMAGILFQIFWVATED